MKRKNPFRLRMDFDGQWLDAAAALMGGAFFLRAVYYFGFRGLSDDLGTLLLFMAFPMILEAAFAIILRAARLNAPGLYGILSAAYCVLLIVQTFFYGNFFRTVLGIAAYAICAIALLALIFNLLRSRGLVVFVFAVVIGIRFVLFDLGLYILNLRLVEFLPEAAALCGLLAMAFLPMGMKPIKKASHRPVEGN